MYTERTSVGLDVHARSTVAWGLDGVTGEVFAERLVPDTAEVLAWLARLPGPVAVAYEAGPTGFGLARTLDAAGIRCLLVAPSKMERPPGDRIKTDRRDAERLARLLRLDELPAVRIPTVEEEAARDLTRAREDTRADLMRARHRLSKLLLRLGHRLHRRKGMDRGPPPVADLPLVEMGDAGAGMLSPIVIAGCGVEVDVLLPSGVSTVEVQNRRRKLAENLNRHEHEVFITIPQAARTVRLWIADAGALDEPIGPSSLVTDASSTANYKTGRAPWGQDLRGDAALISFYQRHLLVTGLSNQGKTVSLRSLALWLALDPTVEFRIADLKGVGDWGMFDGLATVLIQGPTDDHVIAATEMLEELVEEMERRVQAPGGTVFPPLIGIVDEAQNAFMCPVVGADKRPYGGTKATSRYFMAARKIHNQGRVVNVLLWQGTQDPTDQNLPKLVREGAHIRASLVVGTESQARMALGDKAVNGGAAPHLLRQGLDKGTLVVTGDGIKLAPGQSSVTVRTHYIPDAEAIEITDRAKANRTAVATRAATEQDAVEVDPLADVAAVIGDGRVSVHHPPRYPD